MRRERAFARDAPLPACALSAWRGIVLRFLIHARRAAIDVARGNRDRGTFVHEAAVRRRPLHDGCARVRLVPAVHSHHRWREADAETTPRALLLVHFDLNAASRIDTTRVVPIRSEPLEGALGRAISFLD